jgi:ABC-type sugar transport system permease subunit
MENNRKTGESSINVSGSNHVLVLSINVAEQKNNPLMKNENSFVNAITGNPIILVSILVIELMVGVVIALLIFKVRRRKKKYLLIRS